MLTFGKYNVIILNINDCQKNKKIAYIQINHYPLIMPHDDESVSLQGVFLTHECTQDMKTEHIIDLSDEQPVVLSVL